MWKYWLCKSQWNFLSLKWGWDFSSELQCPTYFSGVFSLFSLFKTHIATTENSVWAVVLCHGPIFPNEWNSFKVCENGFCSYMWHHQRNVLREYLNWHVAVLEVLLGSYRILLLEQFPLKAYGRKYHSHLNFNLPEQFVGWSTGMSQEKLKTQ